MERHFINRELYKTTSLQFMRSTIAPRHLVDRIGHYKTLHGHDGCVNCLQWNPSGTILASGSDDMEIRLWNCEGKEIHCIKSGHVNNIFSVQFLPSGHDDIVLSAAGDNSVRMHTVSTPKEAAYSWWSTGRVKRLAVNAADPYLFWSAAEDGYIREYDVRTSTASSLIYFEMSECKSLAINENRPEMMAIALNEPTVPIYDRRNVKTPLLKLIPGHIPISDFTTRNVFRSLSVTHVGFNSLGNEVIVNIGGEQIYIFNVLDRVNEPDALQSLEAILANIGINSPCETVDSAGLEIQVTDRFVRERERAKIHFNNKEYTDAIDTYSRSITACEELCGHDPSPDSPHAADLCLLLSNRAASYLRRSWEGDVYASLLDLIRASKIKPQNNKVHFRIIKTLTELKQFSLARKFAQSFKNKFPNDRACSRFDGMLRCEPDEEKNWLSSNCADYVQRLCGHCNTNTDIKEAVWFGERDEYIAAGSDCGSLMIWERSSGALIKALEADKNILNCVRPHPSSLLLATSGIEHVIRLWMPINSDSDEENLLERRGLSSLSAANQKRMHTGVFDMVVASIGLAMPNEEGNLENARIGCNTS